MEAFGSVHILVNNAGILRDVSFHRMTSEQIDLVRRRVQCCSAERRGWRSGSDPATVRL